MTARMNVRVVRRSTRCLSGWSVAIFSVTVLLPNTSRSLVAQSTCIQLQTNLVNGLIDVLICILRYGIPQKMNRKSNLMVSYGNVM